MLYSHCFYLVPKDFHHPIRKPHIHYTVDFYHPLPTVPGNHEFASVSMDLLILDISYKWSRTI